MDLEFLIVGIAKESEEDLKALYKATAEEVYSMALSIVKDTSLAAEILAETYKRIATLAYLFNTEMSAEYWLLDMAKNISNNALHDPEVKAALTLPKQDNMSKALIELINNSKNDRASIILARTMSSLSMRDIARLLWYKTGACKQEYKRGLNRLSEKLSVTDKKDIPQQLKKDIGTTCPDVWNKIISAEAGPLSHISHEELNLDEEALIYSEEDKENALQEKNEKQKKKKRNTIILIIAICVIIISGIVTVLISNVLDKQDEEGGKITVDVQYGNKISLVQIENKVYYQNNDEDMHLWCYDYSTGQSEELCSDRLKELITDGEKLYYRNYDDGKIYSINTDGSDKKLLTKTAGTCLNYKDGKIYFSSKSGISVINPDGSEETIFVELDEKSEDFIFYEDQGISPYRIHMKFSPEGTLYFSGGAFKGLFNVVDFNGTNGIEAISSDEIYTFDFYNGDIYYDYKILDEELMGTIYLYKLDTETLLSQEVENVIMGTGAFCMDGSVMYYDGLVENEYGIYKIDLSEETMSPEKISDQRASDMYLYQDKLYIYHPETKDIADKYLVSISITENKEPVSIF